MYCFFIGLVCFFIGSTFGALALALVSVNRSFDEDDKPVNVEDAIKEKCDYAGK